MPRLFGRDYSARELDVRIGHPGQIGGVQTITFNDGRARGARAFEVSSGAGLRLITVADRALDVCALEFRGIPLVWHGPGGVAAPAFTGSSDEAFARNFFGGLFTTCGLGNFGPAGVDAYGAFGMHGRVNHLPAQNLGSRTVWAGDSCTYEISGTISEAQMFGEDLTLERVLRVELGSNRVAVHDIVSNKGGVSRPHMMLYHCNMGFPLLDVNSELHVSHRSISPRDACAKAAMQDWNRGGKPDTSFAEQVFIHEPVACADGYARAIMVNRSLDDGRGIALSVRFDPAQLPALFTWRMLGVRTYVMGIEPANCPTIAGRLEAGTRGTLPFLEPGESRTYELFFEVFSGRKEIDEALDPTVGKT
ncbi:MAG: aldose 1-epimerase family protein [Candidatus Eremiobacteraeota bacterium]|nr:aldose 1-epimerase family protein [Candidatus Eremiobacteraeota bacterium]